MHLVLKLSPLPLRATTSTNPLVSASAILPSTSLGSPFNRLWALLSMQWLSTPLGVNPLAAWHMAVLVHSFVLCTPCSTLWAKQLLLPPEATKQAIHLRTMLPILARSVEWGNACHYPLKGHWQGKKMIRWRGQVYLAWGTHCTDLQGKDQENLTGVLWQCLWPLYTTTVFVHVYTRSLDQR